MSHSVVSFSFHSASVPRVLFSFQNAGTHKLCTLDEGSVIGVCVLIVAISQNICGLSPAAPPAVSCIVNVLFDQSYSLSLQAPLSIMTLQHVIR